MGFHPCSGWDSPGPRCHPLPIGRSDQGPQIRAGDGGSQPALDGCCPRCHPARGGICHPAPTCQLQAPSDAQPEAAGNADAHGYDAGWISDGHPPRRAGGAQRAGDSRGLRCSRRPDLGRGRRIRRSPIHQIGRHAVLWQADGGR